MNWLLERLMDGVDQFAEDAVYLALVFVSAFVIFSVLDRIF